MPRALGTSRATMIGAKKMPPPMTFETTMAAASSGPRRRSSEGGSSVVTRRERGYLVISLRSTGNSPMSVHWVEPYFAKTWALGVDELRVVPASAARGLGAGVAELRFDA